MGQMEMKCIFDIGKNISILAKVTQVSDVAHGPLVLFLVGFDSEGNEVVNTGNGIKKEEETVNDSEVCQSDFPLNRGSYQ
jgi:hypothetical protein